ncbi:cadherin-86C-like isoform X2 [Palaemon carinicauda]|uniref:cadherin-86C-like isoform X2 n=1 Tax=Palaemon carinicauda TaxID=392227 RepID=UPI0035B58318
MARWALRHPPLPIRLLLLLLLRLQVPWLWRGRVACFWPLLASALVFLVSWLPIASAVVPKYYEAESMTVLKLPVETEPGELIYRLRALDADRDYPLLFGVSGQDSGLIDIESEYEFGYVYLRQRLNERKNYSVVLTVTDKVGDHTEVLARIIPTKGRTATSDIFVTYSASAVVPENAPVGTLITFVVARKQPLSSVDFTILGPSAHLFKITSRIYSTDTFRGDILLQGKLDYEESNLHALQVCALKPYTNLEVDTRNIVCVTVSVLIEDRQDQPPIFIRVPPVTRITGENIKGDELVKIEAEDGDRGDPRPIRYSMQTSSTQYSRFFAIEETTGSIALRDTVNALAESMPTLEPILATITAVELGGKNTRAASQEYTSSVEIAFVITDAEMMNPKFVYKQYVGEILENSPADTIVVFPNRFLKEGVRGTFSLKIEGSDGIFTVNPNVVRDSEEFAIVVKNSLLLDYESRTRVEFKLIAEQVSGSAQSKSSTEVRVNIIDVNDNYPVFLQNFYRAEIYENITAGMPIARIQATDLDKGDFGAIRYTRLEGKLVERLSLDPVSGLITCATNTHEFDREINPELQLSAVACDDNGFGNCAFTSVTIIIRDINDEAPIFKETVYKGQMTPDQTALKAPLRVEAVDRDAEEPNNQIVYTLDPGIYSKNFRVDRNTGEIFVTDPLSSNSLVAAFSTRTERSFGDEQGSVINLKVTATDQGTPQLSRSVPVQIYTQEYVERLVTFIYPKPKFEVEQEKREIEAMLDALTGGNTKILNVDRFSSQDDTRSAVKARVWYEFKTVVNVEDISQRLNTKLPLITDQANPVQIEVLQGQRNSYLAGVVVLCVFLALIIIAVILCMMCPGCPLYTNRKKRKLVGDENPEQVSYIRVDEQGNYRQGYEEEKIWWDYLPSCCTDIATSCGIPRPKRSVGRLAWSGDERQRYWQFGGGGEGAPLEDRAMRHRGPRDMVLLEDLDEATRLQQQGRMVRVDSRTSHHSGDGRRMFMVRDQHGNPRMAESLREGEHYIMEDIDDTPRQLDPRAMGMNDPRAMGMGDPRMMGMNDPRAMGMGMGMNDPRAMGGMGMGMGMGMNDPRGMRMEDQQPRGMPGQQNADDNATYARQGNVEVLRLRASPHGAVLRDDGATGRQIRQMRRAGGESEETVLFPEERQHHRRTLLHEDAGGGGISSRLVEGQSVGVTPRLDGMHEDGRNFGPTSMRYLRNESPLQYDVQIQTENGLRSEAGYEHVVPRLRIRTPIEEETTSLLEAEGQSTRREKRRRRRNSTQTIVEPQVHDDNTSRRSVRITQPPNTLYQHTKSSILRFETNKAKMDEDSKKESTSRRNSISGTDGRRSSSVDSRSIDGRRSISQANLDGRRSSSQTALEVPRGTNLERRGSLPGMEATGLEREAAKRLVNRRGSLGQQDRQDASLQAIDGKGGQAQDGNDGDSSNEQDNNNEKRTKKQSNPRYMEWREKNKGKGQESQEGKKSKNEPETEVRESGEGSESQTRVVTEDAQKNSQDRLRVPKVDGTSSNLPDDLKAKEGDEELRTIIENEANLGMNQDSLLFENDAEMEAAIKAGRRRKRNHLLEKKSIFTIAYDDMQTDQLRPESAAAEP